LTGSSLRHYPKVLPADPGASDHLNDGKHDCMPTDFTMQAKAFFISKFYNNFQSEIGKFCLVNILHNNLYSLAILGASPTLIMHW
jgi:hypothetical protein